MDCQQPFGNERLLPRGTLREPPSHLARANTIFITKSDGNTDELRRRIEEYNSTAGIIECIHHPLYLEDVFSGKRLGLDFLKGLKVASLSGIAQPESFEKSLAKLGGELVLFQALRRPPPLYAAGSFERHQPRQKSARPNAIITTQKDAVRFPKIDRRDLPIYFMRVEIKILSGAERLSRLRPQNLFPLNHGNTPLSFCTRRDSAVAIAPVDCRRAARTRRRRAGLPAGRATSARGVAKFDHVFR